MKQQAEKREDCIFDETNRRFETLHHPTRMNGSEKGRLFCHITFLFFRNRWTEHVQENYRWSWSWRLCHERSDETIPWIQELSSWRCWYTWHKERMVFKKTSFSHQLRLTTQTSQLSCAINCWPAIMVSTSFRLFLSKSLLRRRDLDVWVWYWNFNCCK